MTTITEVSPRNIGHSTIEPQSVTDCIHMLNAFVSADTVAEKPHTLCVIDTNSQDVSYHRFRDISTLKAASDKWSKRPSLEQSVEILGFTYDSPNRAYLIISDTETQLVIPNGDSLTLSKNELVLWDEVIHHPVRWDVIGQLFGSPTRTERYVDCPAVSDSAILIGETGHMSGGDEFYFKCRLITCVNGALRHLNILRSVLIEDKVVGIYK